ncbi:hypothetical protein FisN_7Hu136 [Fistulifera solaris]|jgi:hypothetical protein|uniref:Uncharacterized protein n=1 Tax=Fistulifera solaris TaxID=1519565 RepID=A0A1Z5K3J7_FISSO|nr:hypothetical protein FisN_7Hu136 [Fistulifera solaris]|eukprot:GAX20823.1 hypothetical protein FisN_7Hu136 [Fistulifera solaris]
MGEAASGAYFYASGNPFLAIFGAYVATLLIVLFFVARRKGGKTRDESVDMEDVQDIFQAARRRKEARDELAQHLGHLKKVRNEVRSQIAQLRAASSSKYQK